MTHSKLSFINAIGKSLFALWVALPLVAMADAPKPETADVLSLKKIMANPDWMGNSPNSAQWSLDDQSIIYSAKAKNHSHQNNFQVNLIDKNVKALTDKDALYVASQSAELNLSQSKGVFSFQGDLFVIDVSSQSISQISADSDRQSNPRFIDDSRFSYFEDHKIFIYDLANGLAKQVADFKLANDPNKEQSKSYLAQSQPRLFNYIAEQESEKKFQKQRRKNNLQSPIKTWYLGKGKTIRTFRLSPNAQWILVGIVNSGLSGKADHMPEFVQADGYVKDRKVRPLVGTSKPLNETFFVFDLKEQQKFNLDTTNLPGINDDPLADLKKSAAKTIGYKYKKMQQPRAIYAYNWLENGGAEWTSNSEKLALNLFSYDNKDRWIVSFDTKTQKLKTLHWMSDDAWVNDWTFNEFGWLPDNETFYYLSEEDGYSHLYIKKGKRRARQLTEGKFEVSDLNVSKDGADIYFKANKPHPGVYEIYKINVKSGKITELTNLGGVNSYGLSNDEKQLVIRHSTTTQMPELYIVTTDGSKSSQKLTNTMSNSFKSINWQAPDIVEVPSTHHKRSIYSRFYKAQNNDKADDNGKKPAVIFVHGAGYLQNAHQGWSGYFREFMFHNLLTRQGYVVLDMDYRASKGYGRDWRTAIYQNMGTPELEDLKDGAKWLTETANVDPKRIGIYGGSYGGFMTFMALFKSPETFAAGAALRPVTDWAHYNHGYTSNILNTPQVDPKAYERSSPIEFAEGLNKPLLIAHGMVDDNVFFKDTVRLVQRLIELEKTPYFETAIYPIEPHSFTEPASWLDEYTRIYLLFERHLN